MMGDPKRRNGSDLVILRQNPLNPSASPSPPHPILPGIDVEAAKHLHHRLSHSHPRRVDAASAADPGPIGGVCAGGGGGSGSGSISKSSSSTSLKAKAEVPGEISMVSSPGGFSRSTSGDRNWRLDHSQFEAARKDPESAGSSSARRRWLTQHKDPVIGYYKRQNEMIDGFSEMDALSEQLLPPTRADVMEAERLAKSERLAILLSNVFNIILLAAKIIASVQSRSLSIIASTLDSLLDCLSGFILWYTARSMRRQNPYKYPIGKNRMQPLGIIVFACIMAMLGLQILIEAVRQLFETTHNAGLGEHWQVYVSIMVFAIAVKTGLWLFCRMFDNDIIQAYALDHFFDVVTNVVGLGAATLAGAFAWWIDPLGAILLSIYTMVNWGRTVYEQVQSLTGQSAPPEYLQKLTYLCWNHHEAIAMIDTVRAYTFGSSYFCEVDVVLPREMPLQEAHDIGESLQNKLETLPEVERAFVHLDYEVSHRPEHHIHAHFQAPPGAPSVGVLPTGPQIDAISP